MILSILPTHVLHIIDTADREGLAYDFVVSGPERVADNDFVELTFRTDGADDSCLVLTLREDGRWTAVMGDVPMPWETRTTRDKENIDAQ